ncbi:MAG: cyclic nucleotide-binding domain-containing protein [Spirochaetaceae bacterium]|jgi:CRP-like cAMP-binding protein|nr:cyclic nucleotide-binding domain-containing protein [Spirochaetaceae bacterium]
MQAYPSFPLVSFPQGSMITKQNAVSGGRFYVIQSGIARISGPECYFPGGKDILVSGDFFSVESALTLADEQLSVTAETDLTAISVTKEAFPAFIKENLPVSTKILNHLSKRLSQINEKSAMGKKKIPHNGLARLYSFGKFYLKRNLFRTAYCAFHQYLKLCPSGKNIENARKYLDKLTSYSNGVRFDYYDREITRAYPVDSAIFFEREPSQGMYVVRSGAVKVTRIIDDKEITLAVLKAGDIVGQMGLIDTKPRSATAIACEDSELLAIAHTAYLPILKDGAHILARICVTLAERIAAQEKAVKGLPECQ